MDFIGNDEDVEVDIEGFEDSYSPARNHFGHEGFCPLSVTETVFLPAGRDEVLHQKPLVTCSEELDLNLTLSGQCKKSSVRKGVAGGKTEVLGKRTPEEIRRSLDLDFGSFLSESFVKSLQGKKENSDETAMEGNIETRKESLTKSCKDLEQKMKELEKQIKLKQAILRDDKPVQSPSEGVVQAEGHEGRDEDVEGDGSLTESIEQLESKEPNGKDVRCCGRTEGFILQPLSSKPALYFMSRVVLSCSYVLNKVPFGNLACDSKMNALFHQLESTWKSFDWRPLPKSETQACLDVLKVFASDLASDGIIERSDFPIEKDKQSKVPITGFNMCEKQHSSQTFTVARRKETTPHVDHVDFEGRQAGGVRQKICVNRKDDEPAASCTLCDVDGVTIKEVNSETFSVKPVIEQSVRQSAIFDGKVSAGLTADVEVSDMAGRGKRTRCETDAVETTVDDSRTDKKAKVESTIGVQEQGNGEMIVDEHNVENLKMNGTHKAEKVNFGGQILESGNNVCKKEHGKIAGLAGEDEEDYLELGDDDSIEMGDTESRLADDWEIQHNSKEALSYLGKEMYNGESVEKRSACGVDKLGLYPSSKVLLSVEKGCYQQQGTENGFASAYGVAHINDFNTNIVPHFAVKSVSAGLCAVRETEGPNITEVHVKKDYNTELLAKVEPIVDNVVKCSENVAQEMEKRTWTQDNKTKEDQKSQPDLLQSETHKVAEVFLRQTAGEGGCREKTAIKTVRTLNRPGGEPLRVLRKRLEENIKICTEQCSSESNLNLKVSLSSEKDHELAFQPESFSCGRPEEDSMISKKRSSLHPKQGKALLLAKHPEKTSRNLEATFENRRALRNTLYSDNFEPSNTMRTPELPLDSTAGLRGRSDRKYNRDVEEGEIANGFTGNKGEKYTEYTLKSGRIVTELIKDDEVSTDFAKRYRRTADHRTDPGKKSNKADEVVVPTALRVRVPEVIQSEKWGITEQTDRSMQNGKSKLINSARIKGMNGSFRKTTSRETTESLHSPSGKSSIRDFEGEVYSNAGKRTDLAYENQPAKPAKAGGGIAGGKASTPSNREKSYEGEVRFREKVGTAAPSPKLVVKILKKKAEPGNTDATVIEDKRGGGNSEGEVKLNNTVRDRLKSQAEASNFREEEKSAMTAKINESAIASGRRESTFSEEETRTIQEMVSTVIICAIDSKRASESGNWNEPDSKLRDALKDMLDSKTWNMSKQKNSRFGSIADSVKKWALGPAPPRIPRWLQEKLDDLYSLDTYDGIEGIPGNLDRLQQIYQSRYKVVKHANEFWRTFHSKVLHRERSRSLSPKRHGFMRGN